MHSGASDIHERATTFIAVLTSMEGGSRPAITSLVVVWVLGRRDGPGRASSAADRAVASGGPNTRPAAGSQGSVLGRTRTAPHTRTPHRWPASPSCARSLARPWMRLLFGKVERGDAAVPTVFFPAGTLKFVFFPGRSGPLGASMTASHADLRSEWAATALTWISACPLLHPCNRSVQIFRGLRVPVTQQALADILARLAETVGSTRDEGTACVAARTQPGRMRALTRSKGASPFRGTVCRHDGRSPRLHRGTVAVRGGSG